MSHVQILGNITLDIPVTYAGEYFKKTLGLSDDECNKMYDAEKEVRIITEIIAL